MFVNKIKVIDAVMGTGKTSYCIQQMKKNANTGKQYIFVTPYLDEVKRVKDACPECDFAEPLPDAWNENKSEAFKDFLADGRNIVTTHNLLRRMDVESLTLIESKDYTLIMDEVMDVVEPLKLRKNQYLDGVGKEDSASKREIAEMFARDLLRRGDPISEDGSVCWVDAGTATLGRYNDIKEYAEGKRLAMVNDMLILWLFPVSIFKAFSEVWNLCYLFEGQMQKAYYDAFSLEYDYYTVTGKRPEDGGKGFSLVDYEFGKSYELRQLKMFSKLIDLVESPRWNAVGDPDNHLTFSFFNYDRRHKRMHSQLSKNLDTFFRDAGGRITDRMWCCYKGPTVQTKKVKGETVKVGKHEKAIGRPRFRSAFVACNVRATNRFKDRSIVAYCINRKLEPMKVHFFKACNVDLDEDLFALSEMVQWIWRSRIRTYDPIRLYVPSRRMRELLKQWLKGAFTIAANPRQSSASTTLVEVDRLCA